MQKSALLSFWTRLIVVLQSNCKVLQTCANSCKGVQTFANTCKLLQVFANFLQNFATLCIILRLFTNFETFAKACTTLQNFCERLHKIFAKLLQGFHKNFAKILSNFHKKIAKFCTKTFAKSCKLLKFLKSLAKLNFLFSWSLGKLETTLHEFSEV